MLHWQAGILPTLHSKDLAQRGQHLISCLCVMGKDLKVKSEKSKGVTSIVTHLYYYLL